MGVGVGVVGVTEGGRGGESLGREGGEFVGGGEGGLGFGFVGGEGCGCGEGC